MPLDLQTHAATHTPGVATPGQNYWGSNTRESLCPERKGAVTEESEESGRSRGSKNILQNSGFITE